jgi:GTP pyrophosphokinase
MLSVPETTPTALTTRYDAALLLASELHRAQRRKGSGAPYLSHLLCVSALVLEYGGDEDEAIAALLHDAVEDQGGAPTLERIAAEFGPRVAAIVAGCTEEQYQERGLRWRERKDNFIASLADADPSVRLIVAADKLHNASSYLRDYALQGPAVWTRFKDGHAGVSWFLRAVADALAAAGGMPILRELDEAISRIEALRAEG